MNSSSYIVSLLSSNKEQQVHVPLRPTLKDLVGDHSRPKREYDGISILPVLNGKKTCIDRDFYLGHGAVVNKDYKLIRKGMKPEHRQCRYH